MKNRNEFDFPQAIQEWGWKFHHLGIPTDDIKANENYLDHLKFSVSGFNDSPYGVEWMRFNAECKMPELIQQIPHLAFVVNDLDYELKTRNFNIITEPNPPMEGIRVAMIEHNGAPIELMEFTK
jgi:hypothetical protein